MSNLTATLVMLGAVLVLSAYCIATVAKIYSMDLSPNGLILYGAKLVFRSALLFAGLMGFIHGVDLEWQISARSLFWATIYNLLQGIAWLIPVSLTAIGANLVSDGLSSAKNRRLTGSQVARGIARNFLKLDI